MVRRIRRVVGAFFTLSLALFACAGAESTPPTESDVKTTGSEGAKCYPNGTCDLGLTCLSQLCVDVGGAGGKAGSAGSPAAGKGGTFSTGGAGTAGSTAAAGMSMAGAGSAGTGGTAAQGGAGTAGANQGGANQGGAGQGGAGQGGAGQAASGQAGAGQAGASTGGTAGAGGSTGGAGGDVGASGFGGQCAGAVYVAKQAPAAMVILVDRSSSMEGAKWTAATDAIEQAIDQDSFDDMSLALLAAPAEKYIAGPACLLNLPVPCQAPAAPQVVLEDSLKAKSTAAGVRAKITQFMAGHPPTNAGLFDADASPLYAAMQSSINALKAWPGTGKRLLFVVSDGTISCNQSSNRPGFPDANGCDHDWEDPNNIVALLTAANGDATKPIDSFIVGVPGADTYDDTGATYPPYHMRLALSAIAYAGAPTYVDPNCTGTAFTQGGGDPAVSCHFDLTQGNFGATELAATIAKIRGKTLSCTFDVPVPPSGETIDTAKVNVQMSFGMGAVEVFRRKDASDTCPSDYCWDFDAAGKVELVGKACDDLKGATKAGVSVVAGCSTFYKP